MYIFCIIMICVASILLILAVLVQSPKSGMAANFGASNQVMGVRQTTDFLEKFTWGMAVAILVLSLLATTAMDSHLVEQSNASAADANALIEKIATPAEQSIPQVEIPAEQPVEAPAETPAE